MPDFHPTHTNLQNPDAVQHIETALEIEALETLDVVDETTQLDAQRDLLVAPSLETKKSSLQVVMERLKRPLKVAAFMSVGAGVTTAVAPQVGLALWAAPAVAKALVAGVSIGMSWLLTYAPEKTIWVVVGALIGAALCSALCPGASIALLTFWMGIGGGAGKIAFEAREDLQFLLLCGAGLSVVILLNTISSRKTSGSPS